MSAAVGVGYGIVAIAAAMVILIVGNAVYVWWQRPGSGPR